MSKKIYIDAGHGGKDPGAVSDNFIEKQLNLKVALALREYLSTYDCEVVMSRTTDTQTKINEMAANVKAIGAAASISIHHNSGGGIGAEVFYWKGDEKARKLASLIANEFFDLGQTLRRTKGEEPGVKPSEPQNYNFGMCRINSNNGIPAVLGEFAFVDSKGDSKLINSDEKLKAEGEAYGRAIVEYLGLKKKATVYTPNPIKKAPTAGDKINLKNVKLYSTAGTGNWSRVISGTYWIYDGEQIFGRYRITNKVSSVRKKPAILNVTGWINKSDINL